MYFYVLIQIIDMESKSFGLSLLQCYSDEENSDEENSNQGNDNGLTSNLNSFTGDNSKAVFDFLIWLLLPFIYSIYIFSLKWIMLLSTQLKRKM